jgi:hypothetical protein
MQIKPEGVYEMKNKNKNKIAFRENLFIRINRNIYLNAKKHI